MCGIWKFGARRTCSGIRSGPMRVPVRQHDRALDDVLELAHVARPVVVHQQIERFGRQLECGPRVLVAVLLEEVLDEQRDVVLALAQRRQLDAITCSR